MAIKSLLFDCPTGNCLRRCEITWQTSFRQAAETGGESRSKRGERGTVSFILGPGGPAPGREVSYRGWVQPGYMLSELSSYYEAFSYKPMTKEVPDHVAVETGFIAYLRLKEAFAARVLRHGECKDHGGCLNGTRRRSPVKICRTDVQNPRQFRN